MRGHSIYTAEGRLNTKLQRQRDIMKSDDSDVPASYKSNSIKEELCLEYINSFISQYTSIYTKRKIPFMVAENEYGVRKFVGATLRPTLIPVPELYDLYECAAFFAGYILYEPLDPPMEPPRYLFSPQQVIENNRGDSFDMAHVLCSFLLGAGYDAYVVHGYAPKYIGLKDQSLTRCPIISEKNNFVSAGASSGGSNESKALDSEPGVGDVDGAEQFTATVGEAQSTEENYVPPDNSVKSSRFILQQQELKRLQAIDKFALWLGDEDTKNDDEELLAKEREALNGNMSREDYVHCWVLVKAGRRDVLENIFVEPSTGRVYRPQRSPYYAIEAVWNNTNFHVNGDLDRRIADMDFNFYASTATIAAINSRSGSQTPRTPRRLRKASPRTNANSTVGGVLLEPQIWETLFLGEAPKTKKQQRSGEEGHEEDEDDLHGDGQGNNGPETNPGGSSGGAGKDANGGAGDDNENGGAGLRYFDAPPKWSMPLSIPRSRYLAKYPPNGRRTVQYYCAKADFFARGTNAQGMVLRITRYLDKQCTMVSETTEWFENRADRMYKRVRTFLDTKMNPTNPAQPGLFQDLGTSGKLGETLLTTTKLSQLFGARKVVQYYQAGAKDDIQCWTDFPGKCVAVDYFVAGRLDRIQRRVEVLGECVCEWYVGRYDRMTYRETLITTDRALALFGPHAHSHHGRGAMHNRSNVNTAGSSRIGTATSSAPPTANSSTNNLVSGRHYLISRSNQLTLDIFILRMTIEYGKSPDVNDGSDIARRIFFIRDGKAVFIFHPAHQQVAGKMKTLFHTKNMGGGAVAGGVPATGGGIGGGVQPPITPAGVPSTNALSMGGIAAMSEAALAQEMGLEENQDMCLEAAALEREYYSNVKSAGQDHERLVEYIMQTELSGNGRPVEMEYSIFDQALDKVDAYRATLQPTKHRHHVSSEYNPFAASNTNKDKDANANAANKGVDYLAPFLKHAGDPNHLSREEALAIRQACLDALKARLVERASIIQSKLHEENSKLAKRQEQFQRSQREGDYSTEDFEKYCTEAMFRIQILENRLSAHEDAAPQKYAALDAKLMSDPRLRVLKA